MQRRPPTNAGQAPAPTVTTGPDGFSVSRTGTAPAAADALGEGGRGLVVVGAVADRWGVTPCADGRGRTVWFECGRD